MTDPIRVSYVAECFWTGVTEDQVRELDDRAEASAGHVSREGEAIRFLGSILMLQDEVVLFLFEGSATAVRRAADLAGIPFERILESSNSRWPATPSAPPDRGASSVPDPRRKVRQP